MSESTPRTGLTRHQIRKVLDKDESIRRARPEIRDLAMSIAGVSTERELLMSILLPKSKGTQVISHIASVAAADPIPAVVATLELGKDAMREMHRVLTSLGHLDKRMNVSDAKAAAELVTAIQNIDQWQRDELNQAAALLDAGK